MLDLCPAPLLDVEGSGDTQGLAQGFFVALRWNVHRRRNQGGQKGHGPPDFTCYDFGPPPQIMYFNLTTLYNELVYYLHTHLLLSDTINSYKCIFCDIMPLAPDILWFICL